jgi:hypothetical protein
MSSIFTKHKITKSRKSRKSRKSPKSGKSRKSPKSSSELSYELPSNIDKFLYPFWYNKISFPEVSTSHLYQLYHDTAWNKHLELAFKMYGYKSSLPKGSILFHGANVIDPVKNTKPIEPYFFFGLDAFISIWYVSEQAYLDYKKDRTITDYRTITMGDDYYNNYNGYLNIYQTLEAIPYKYLRRIEQSYHPDNNKECENMACMHPQLGYHFIEFQNFMPTELSIEFTIPTKNITEMLELIGVYKVDVLKLYENTYKNFDEFKALDAVMFETNLAK